MSRNSDDYLIFLAGTLVGVLSGVVAGIMFSPRSGVEMRKELKNMSKKLYNEVPSDIDLAKKAFYKSVDKMKYTVEEQITKINEAVKAGKMASAKRTEEMDTGY